MSSKSRSRSRSRSASRSPRRYRRNARDDSMSPIRTASGANLRTPKNYNSGGQGYGYRNYQNNNNRGGFYNDRGGFYNDRGFHNQRYNNYGRWNRGRGNYRGGWQDRNQWNHRSRYNSRSDRSRSRSRSKSYDRRDRSHSSSDSRSRSRSLSRDRDRRRRNRSVKGDERRRDCSKSKSKSKTPAKSVEKSKEEVSKMTPKKEEAPVITVEVPSTEPEAEGEKRNDSKTHFAETPAFTRSRWESPNASADEKQKQNVEMDIEQDEIFDQWDDDKLRAYLLKSKGKKLGKDAKKLLEVAETEAPSEVPVKQKKKKRSKSNADSPTKESRGRKKKRAKQSRSTSESSSSSSSWSPIHKAPEPSSKAKEEPEAPMPSERQKQEYSQAPSNVYSHLQTYSASNERTQAVQYPFSHIRKSTPPVPALAEPTPPPPPVPVAQYPTPVPPPQPPLPAMPPVFGEMQVLGPDGTPMRLVPTSVPGPDGKMIQVMQVVQPSPAPTMPQASVPPPSAPVSQSKQTYRIPPPPPSYPPPPTTTGKYPVPPSVTTSTANPSEIYKPEGFMEDLPSYEEISGYPNAQTSVPASVKEVPVVEKEPYQPSNHTSGLKKMEMMEKQKRRQEVLKTRFTPRPAGSWAQEVKREKVEVKGESKNDKKTGSNQEQRGRAIPSLADPANRTKRPTHEDFVPNFPPDPNEIGMMSGSGRRGQKTMADQRETDPPRVQDGVQHSTVQNVQGAFPDANTQHAAAYPATSSFVAQGFKAVKGNPQIFMGPNGEMLQMISPNQPPAPQPIPPAAYHASVQKPPDTILNKNTAQHDQRGVREMPEPGLLHKKQKSDSRKEVSTDEEDLGASARQRTISTGSSEKKSKKKLKSASTEDSAEEDEPVKRKKEKKRKKKNKKKKDQADDETHVKEKKKKKEKRQKEKSELFSLEHETIASKKDLKAFEEVKKKSKDDHLNRSVDDDLPLSHIRAIVPRKKREATEPLLRYVEDTAKPNLAASTSYEDRFVSLFGSGEVDSPSTDHEERIDITKKSVRKFKINVKGTRDVTHMTEISLSERIKHFDESGEEEKESQKVQISLNVSGFSKTSRSSRSRSKSRSRSRSSSASSDSRRKSKKKKKKKRRSRSSSRSNSRSKSRSVSLPKAYSSMDDKPGRRGRSRSGSHAKDYSDDDLRHDLEKRKAAKDRSGSRSRSRSRSYSSDEGRNRNRGRQMHYNNNNQGYHFNNRGRGRGYFQNFRGRGWFNNNNRGNFRGRWNWNNQGWNNRNQGYPYQRYDNRDNNRDHRYRGRSRDRSRSRSRSRDDRSSSHERDARRNGKHRDEKSPKKEEKPMEQEQKQSGGQGQPSTQSSDGNGKPARKPSPAQWGHDMFEEHETEDKKEPAT